MEKFVVPELSLSSRTPSENVTRMQQREDEFNRSLRERERENVFGFVYECFFKMEFQFG